MAYNKLGPFTDVPDGTTAPAGAVKLSAATLDYMEEGIRAAAAAADAAGGGSITAADITDSTTTGRNVLTATSQANARSAIGAGTSSLATSAIEGIKAHDGTTGGGTRPAGFARVRWIGGTTRPTNMATGDVWEH